MDMWRMVCRNGYWKVGLSSGRFSVNFAFNVLAAQTLPVLTTALGMPGLFALYASVCLLSLAFIKAVVPETKGRTLEEIEDLLGLGTRDEPGAP